MPNLYKYRYFCQTEGVSKNIWNTSFNNLCFVNSSHTIDQNSVTIIDKQLSNTVQIKEEIIDIGGRFRVEGFSFTAPANSTYIFQVSWKIPLNILAVFFIPKEDNIGDVINTIISPATTIGVINTSLSIGDTVIPITSQVFSNIEVGFEIFINDDLIGEVISIDYTNQTVTISDALTNNYSNGSLIKIQIRIMKNLTINGVTRYSLGLSKIGGAVLYANIPVHVVYTNNNTEEAGPTNFTFEIEYLY